MLYRQFWQNPTILWTLYKYELKVSALPLCQPACVCFSVDLRAYLCAACVSIYVCVYTCLSRYDLCWCMPKHLCCLPSSLCTAEQSMQYWLAPPQIPSISLTLILISWH